MQSWLGIHQRPQDFRITPDQNHWARRGVIFLGLGQHPKGFRFTDSSLYGTHGTLTDMDPATDWVFDSYLGRWSLAFGNLQVVMLDRPALNGLSAFTACGWIYRKAGQTAALFQSYLSPKFQILCRTTSTGAMQFYTYTGSQVGGAVNLTNTESVWQHVAYVYDGAQMRAYLNGVVGSTTYAQSGALNAADVLGFGGKATSSGSEYILSGSCADPLLYNRALSVSGIQQLADPSNVMLSGLILPPTRKFWPVAAGGAPAGISASAVCVGTNATVSAAATVRVAASAVATGTNATVASAAKVAIAATSACVGGNATLSAAAKVAISASAVCAGANAVVVARSGEAPAETYKPMMFMVC